MEEKEEGEKEREERQEKKKKIKEGSIQLFQLNQNLRLIGRKSSFALFSNIY